MCVEAGRRRGRDGCLNEGGLFTIVALETGKWQCVRQSAARGGRRDVGKVEPKATPIFGLLAGAGSCQTERSTEYGVLPILLRIHFDQAFGAHPDLAGLESPTAA